jgi:iron complex outermembrane receptor protein
MDYPSNPMKLPHDQIPSHRPRVCVHSLAPAASHRGFSALAAIGFFLGLSAAAPAQTAIQPSVPKSLEKDTLELSPFIVKAEQDNGYQAGNTLAGSRFNTKLSETAASVSVFTEEFLRDLGATGIAQVLEYGINANVDFNSNTTGASFFYMDDALLNEVRINNRGLFGQKTIDYFESNMMVDVYNTGRMEVSSGPNSVLFGFGAAGGIINVATQRADVLRNSARVTGVMSSWNGYRDEVNLNAVVIKNKVGLRFMQVHDETDTWKLYGGSKIDRYTFATTIKPFKSTTITASYEKFEMENHTARQYNRQDSLSFWHQQGRQVVDNTNLGTSGAAVNNAAGIRAISFRNVWDANDGIAMFSRSGGANSILWESASLYETGMNSGIDPRRLESGNLQTLLPTEPQPTGLPYAPYNINYYGPEAIRNNSVSRKFARLEQQLGKDGYLELAFNQEWATGHAHEFTGDFTLYGDPNKFIPNPDGTTSSIPNPRAGQLYVEQVWYQNIGHTKTQSARAMGSWKLHLGQMFGEHQLIGMAERSLNYNETWQGPEILINPNTGAPMWDPTVPESGTNWLFRRNYVTEGKPETYIPGSRLDPRPINYGGVGFKTRLINGSAAATDRRIDSLMLATQSKFWNNRIIVTGGLRRDKVDVTPSLAGRLPANDPRVLSGERLVNEIDLVGIDTAIVKHYTFDTYTAGAVLGVTKNINAFYNESNNNGASQTVRRMLPDASIPTPPEGTGRDWGAMFGFLDGKVFIRATMYQTVSRNDPSVRDATFIGAHRRILGALFTNGYISQAELDKRSLNAYLGDFLSDLASKGTEVELKANPTKNWTLTAAYSFTKFNRSNLGQDWYPWFEEQKKFYAQYPATLVTSANLPISSEITQIETGVEDLFALNRLGYNNRPHKANGFARYSFTEGKLKGFFAGGGVRWQSGNIMQRDLVGFNPVGGKDVLGKILYGPAIFNVDALVGYSTTLKIRPLGNPTTLRVQLNVANLLNDDTAQIIRLSRVGFNGNNYGIWRAVPRDPRSYRLSASLAF